jgi:nucleoside-diphosphate-sugar epimerase
MNKQRILVLGLNDVIGRRVATALASSDWATAVVLKAEAPRDESSPYECIDATNSSALAANLLNCDGIVAAFAGSPNAIRSQAAAVFAKGVPPFQQRIVHVSSMAVYGEASGNVDERAPFGKTLSAYAQARVAAETLARIHPNVVTLRPGCEYGPECLAWSARVAQWLTARRLGDLGARGDGVCNLVYIDDVVSAVLKALRTEGLEGQGFNLAMPLPPTWNEYFMQFAKALGALPVKRITKRRLQIETKLLAPPLKVVEIGARIVRISSRLFAPAIPPSAAAVFTQELHLSSSKATQELAIAWTPLDRGLRNTARWLQSVEQSN